MKEERIKAVKTWLKLTLVKNILVFLRFANFCQRFIKRFGKLAALLIYIVQTTNNREKTNHSIKNDDKNSNSGVAKIKKR